MLADIRDVPELHQRLAAQERVLEEQRQEIELLKRGRKGLFNLQYQEFKELERAHEIEKNKWYPLAFIVCFLLMSFMFLLQKPPTPPVLPKPNPHGLFSNFASGSKGELYKVEEYPKGKYTYTVEFPDGTKRQMTNYEKDLYPQLKVPVKRK